MTNNFPQINFIGNKEKIVNWITDLFPPEAKSIFDAFAGGSSVGYESKKRGLKVISNDILKVNHLLSKSLIENSSEVIDDKDIEIIFSGIPKKGFMYNTYSNIYFFPKECMELDLYRENLERLSSEYKKAMTFSLLRRAMIRKMPYSRFNIKWDKIVQLRDEDYSYKHYKRKRAYHNQSFKSHFLENLAEYNSAVFDNKKDNVSLNADIFSLIGKTKADIIYLDPPYTGTMNDYFGFYGLMDEYYYSKKIKPFENNFRDKNTSVDLFDELFSNLKNFKYWFLSYNNSSHLSKEQIMTLLRKHSNKIKIVEKKHTYKITGSDKKNTNKEYLFIVKNI